MSLETPESKQREKANSLVVQNVINTKANILTADPLLVEGCGVYFNSYLMYSYTNRDDVCLSTTPLRTLHSYSHIEVQSLHH